MASGTGILKRLLGLPAYALGGINYKLAGFLYTPRPRFVCFPVTFRCNSRCQMCNIWQTPAGTEEISLDKIQEVFSNRLFSKVEEVVLHGGEPTLRKDIKEIYRIIIRACPRLKKIISSTNGLKPGLVDTRVREILSVVDPEETKLVFTVSIDGMKESHEKIRGIRDGFDRAIETLEVFRKYQERYPIEVQIITVIQPQNLAELDHMEDLARKYEVELIFQPLMLDTFYNNLSPDSHLRFTESQYEEYRRFIQKRFADAQDARGVFWNNFVKMMGGAKRSIPCAYDRYVLSLYPTGEVHPCAKEDWVLFGNVYEGSVDAIWFSPRSRAIRKRMKKELCPTCSFYCGAEYSLQKEFFTYVSYRIKKAIPSLFRARN